MNEIFVCNKNDFDHTDVYDGHDYNFPQGEKVLVSIAAARHMFGFGNAVKTDNLVRLGWANLQNDEGVARLAKFVFTQPMVIEQPVDEAAMNEVVATSE